MFVEKKIKLKNKDITGIEINLHNANLVLAIGSRGYICCGYLNLDTAEKLKDAACIVTGVKTVEDLFAANIIKCTQQAEALGIKNGMNAKEALEKYL